MTDTDNAPGHLEGTSNWEWLAAAVSACIFASMIGYLLYQGLTHTKSPPDVAIAVDKMERTGAGYRVEFTARNNGDQTAASLQIRATLFAGDTAVEESRAVIDYLPGQSRRGGGLFFTRNPAQGRLEIRSEGYSLP